ncbi:hypothetical protein GIB67_012225 [Kingdonia uniflora]|uniref:Aminotransferase-like plant mobile domain-containing protein n=1 Tax=Kingdonia uniflora TaxID=39325 RepID=A0A7J7NVB7_9MAGN|nr:hypothetical protein GIB67_012225 [Kingdonia uniflora]
MQNLTMSLEEEEYDGTGDEEGSESDYSEGHVSQLYFLSGKKRKNDFEEVVNVSIEPPPPLSQNHEARDFRQLTQPDGNGHLSTSVATTSARVGFKYRSVLVKLYKIYVILIEVPHLKQRLKVTNLMIVKLGMETTKIGIGTGEPMEFDESSTDYGNAIKSIYAIALWRCLIWELEELGSTRVVISNCRLENKAYTIDFGSAILGHLYYCLDQASKQEVKYISGLFQLIEYHCYEYYQIGHHILIDNRLDDFWPRMSVWQTKRQKVTGNKAKHHLILMRQQLDLRIINNMQWDPFRNMKDALKREVIIASNISRKRVLLQCPFGGYEWYLRDRYWAQLEHRAMLFFYSGDTNPTPQLGDYPRWIMKLGWPHRTMWHTIPSIASTSSIDVPIGYDFFTMNESIRKLTLDRTLDLEARHLHDESRITHLTVDLRCAEGHLSQLNDYLDGEGIVVDWEDDEGEVGTSQAGTSRGRGSRGRGLWGRTYEEEEDEGDIEQSSTDYSDDDVIDEIKLEILRNQAEIKELEDAKSSRTREEVTLQGYIANYDKMKSLDKYMVLRNDLIKYLWKHQGNN